MDATRKEFRINIGFLLNQVIGYHRDFNFDIPKVKISDEHSIVDFQGKARISRTPQGLLVEGSFNSRIDQECVRCLETFEQNLTTNFDELYAFSQRTVTESGLILPEDGYIDLYPLVCEYLLIEVPISPLCKPDCLGLCPVCGANRNLGPCAHQTGRGGGEMK